MIKILPNLDEGITIVGFIKDIETTNNNSLQAATSATPNNHTTVNPNAINSGLSGSE
jgi:hypothetical protein